MAQFAQGGIAFQHELLTLSNATGEGQLISQQQIRATITIGGKVGRIRHDIEIVLWLWLRRGGGIAGKLANPSAKP